MSDTIEHLKEMISKGGLKASFGEIRYNSKDRKALDDAVLVLSKHEKLKAWLVDKEKVYFNSAKSCLDINGCIKVDYDTSYYRLVGKLELLEEVLGELR